MASVHSPLRSLVKPLLFKLLGQKAYLSFQVFGKIRDIKNRALEEPEMQLYHHFITQDACILDVGANYAYHTHRFAELAPQGRILAFEPIPFTYKALKRIGRYFNLKNVEYYPLGLADKTGDIEFELPLQDFGGISAGQSHLGGRNNDLADKDKHYQFQRYQTISCQVQRLDDGDYRFNKLDFVKLDIEGAEFFALKGMMNTLKQFKPIIYMEINPFFLKGFGIEESELNTLISDLGYSVFAVKNNSLHAFNENYIEGNYYLLPKESIVEFKALIRDLDV